MSGVPLKSPPDLAALRVDIATLRRKGVSRHDISTMLEPAWLAIALDDVDAEVNEAGRVEMDLIFPSDGPVVGMGKLRFAYRVPCGRCLEPASVDVDAEISATYVVGEDLPAPSGAPGAQSNEDEPGLGLSADDLDTWLFDGHTLQLDALVIEHVRLSRPMRALCTRGEGCRGLCSRCGENLNAATTEVCPQCGAPWGDAAAASDPEGPSGPLAEALRKLQLPK